MAGSEDIFSETGRMPETLCGGSVFKFYHSSPLGHTFITPDRLGRRRKAEMRYPNVTISSEDKIHRKEKASMLSLLPDTFSMFPYSADLCVILD